MQTNAIFGFDMVFIFDRFALIRVVLFSFLICLIGFGPDVRAQGRYQLKGVVMDAASNRPVYRAAVRSGKYSQKTDNLGYFELDVVAGEQLLVSNVGFQTRRIAYDLIKGLDSIAIYLSPSSTGLTNVIQSETTEVVYEKGFENVLDYAFFGDTMAILAYMDYKPRTPKSPETYLRNTLTLNKYGEQLERLVLPEGVQGLYFDPFNRLWIIGNDFVLEVMRQEAQISLKKTDVEFFNNRIAPASVASPYSILFTEVMPIIPQVNYYVYLAGGDSAVPVRYIRNEAYFKDAPGHFRMLSDDQKRQAYELQEKYGINAVDLAPYVRLHSSSQTFMYDSKYLRMDPVDYPETQAFGLDDRLLIFDVLNAWIYHHDMRGNPIDSVPMYHHEFDGERYRGMLQDRMSGQCYALHEKGGAVFLRKLSLKHGAAGRPFKLGNIFPKSVRIFNGHVYYTYRDKDSRSFHKLMREKLPLRQM